MSALYRVSRSEAGAVSSRAKEREPKGRSLYTNLLLRGRTAFVLPIMALEIACWGVVAGRSHPFSCKVSAGEEAQVGPISQPDHRAIVPTATRRSRAAQVGVFANQVH